MRSPEGLYNLSSRFCAQQGEKSHLIGTDIWWFHVSSSHSILFLYFCLIHFWYLFDCMMKLTSICNPPLVFVAYGDIFLALFIFRHHRQVKHEFMIVVVAIGFPLMILYHFKQIMTSESVKIVTNFVCLFRKHPYIMEKLWAFARRSINYEFYCY